MILDFRQLQALKVDLSRFSVNCFNPFFKQAEIIYFGHIEEDIFFEFVSYRFQKNKITLKREIYDYLYQICYGITGDIQTFCRVAYDILQKGTSLDFKTFFYTIDIIYKNEQKYFKSVLDRKDLTKIQKNLLIQLSRFQDEGKVKLFGKDFQRVIGVKSPGAVTNALNALVKKEYIYKSDDNFYFANPFLKEWILDYRLFIQGTAGTLTAGTPLSGTRLDFGFRQRLMKGE